VFHPKSDDPNEKFKQVDETWYYLDQLALTAMETSRPREAVGLAGAVVELYPDNAAAHTTYGYTLALAGDKPAALKEYHKALQLDPTDTRALEFERRITP
jgi:Flp pilus assembly protein TadD